MERLFDFQNVRIGREKFPKQYSSLEDDFFKFIYHSKRFKIREIPHKLEVSSHFSVLIN